MSILLLFVLLAITSCKTQNYTELKHQHLGNYENCSLCKQHEQEKLEINNKLYIGENYIEEVTPLVKPDHVEKEFIYASSDHKYIDEKIHTIKYKSASPLDTINNRVEKNVNVKKNDEEKVDREKIIPSSLIGFIFGVLGLATMVTIIGPLIAVPLGIVFSLIGLRNSKRNSISRIIAIIGLILSLTPLILGSLLLVILITVFL